MDAVGQNRKQLYEGKEWDYVFKVDIKDGAPPLSLPYNATGMHKYLTRLRQITHCFEENPYSAAQRFLARNDLPMEYLDQVVGFIEKNSGGVKVQSSQQFVDPYTGTYKFQLAYPTKTPTPFQVHPDIRLPQQEHRLETRVPTLTRLPEPPAMHHRPQPRSTQRQLHLLPSLQTQFSQWYAMSV